MFKAVYITMLVSIEHKLAARRKFIDFLTAFGIPFVEGAEELDGGYVSMADKYRPVIIRHGEHCMALAALEENFKADITALCRGIAGGNVPPPPAPLVGLPPIAPPPLPAPTGPEMHKVQSTNVDSFGYTAATKTLRVKFTNGDVYDYEQVPHGIADGMRTAQSPGGFLAAHVKGSFLYKKL